MSLAASVARIGKLASIYVVGAVIPMVVGFALMPVFTTYLKTAEMGVVNLAGRLSAPMAMLIQLGLVPAFKSAYFRTNEELRGQLTRTATLGQLAQASLFCIILGVIGIWFADDFMPNLPLSREMVFWLWLMIVGGSFFNAFMILAIRLMQLLENALAGVGINLLSYFLQAGLGLIAVVVMGWGGFGRVGGVTAGFVVAGLVAVWVLLRHSSGAFRAVVYGQLLRTGLTFVPHSLSGVLALSVNAWLLNKLVSASALGVYGIALTFAHLLEFPLGAFNHAAYPTLARLMSQGDEEARRQQARLYTLLLTGFMIFTLTMALFAPVAIRLLAHPRYHGAIQVLPLLVFAYLFEGFYLIAGTQVLYTGRGLSLTAATLTSLVANLVLSLLLIPPFGMYGAAYAMIGCYAVRFLVILVISQRIYPLPWQVGVLVRALLVALGLGLADLWLGPSLGLWVGVGVKVVLLAAAFPLMWVVGVVTRQELESGRRMIATKARSLFGRKSADNRK